jgi:hypothetical protein
MKSQAGPSDRRTASARRGSICGSTTLTTICQVEAPSVCALMTCSRGISPTRSARSRTRNGAMPITIRTTLDSSPKPKTMNSTGRIAMGGTMDSTATTGESPART